MRFRRNRHERCGLHGQRLRSLTRLCVGAGLTACLWLGAAEAEALPPQPVTAAAVREALSDLLGELRTRQLVPGAEAELRRIACQALLDAFASGGVVVAVDGASGAAPAVPPPLLTRVVSGAGRFGYLQIGAVEAGLVPALSEAKARLSVPVYDGTVVDLRDSAGNDLGAATACADLIGTWGHPAVVIVNRRTRGAAEVLAAGLRTGHGAVILGEPTRGLPYPLRPVRLAGNLDVMLPEVPASGPIEPLQPDVPATSAASGDSAPWRGRASAPSADAHDGNVRQALDLLTAICTFQQKHF